MILEVLKFGKFFGLWKFGIVRPFDIPHYSQFCQFSYLPSDTNQFSPFLFPILLTRKFDHSTYERSLIFKIEPSAILKFYCVEFLPSPFLAVSVLAINIYYSVSKKSVLMSKF